MISEKGVKKSFKMAKKDISELQYEVSKLIETQKALKERIAKLGKKKAVKAKPKVAKKKASAKKKPAKKAPSKKVKIVTKRAKKTFVARKGGKKFHTKNCPYAKNILPKHKKIFTSKTKALNEGYKPCTCVK